MRNRFKTEASVMLGFPIVLVLVGLVALIVATWLGY